MQAAEPPPSSNDRSLSLDTTKLILLRAFIRAQAAHITQSIVKGAIRKPILPGTPNEELLTFLAETDLAIARALGVPAITTIPVFHPYFPTPKHARGGTG